MTRLAKRNKWQRKPQQTSGIFEIENVIPHNVLARPLFVQAKPVLGGESPDISGKWSACGQEICLTQGAEECDFSGLWGMHDLVISMFGYDIGFAKMGSVHLAFGGTVASDGSRIEWGNGQTWTKLASV